MMDDFKVWLEGEGRSLKTIREYQKLMQKFAAWFAEMEGAEFLPEQVTTLHIHEFVSYLDKTRQYEPAYINKILATLKTYYKFAQETDLVSYNPMVKVRMKRTTKQYAAPKWLTKTELAKFFHMIESNPKEKQKARDRAICRMMAGAGLRVQEVADLNCSDICLEERREIVTVRGGKGNKYRIVPLNGDVVESLKLWLSWREKLGIEEREPLFVNKIGKRLSDRGMRYLVAKYAAKAKLGEVSPHTLRHSFCKNLADQGYGLQIIA